MTAPPTVPVADGVEMPLLGFGTWQLRGSDCYDAVRYALEVGYRHLDTATMYGNEAEVGRALRDSGLDRGEVFLTTKLPPAEAKRARETLTASLRALGTDHVDLWLIHWPPDGRAHPPTWRSLLAAQEDKQARAVGVSNYDLGDLDELIEATGRPPAVNQVPWNPFRYDPRLLDGHRRRRVVLAGYSPLRGSDLRSPVLVEIADRHGVTPAQVVLRWHLEHGIPVIPKSADRERIARNADVYGFSLDADEVARIDGRR